jgi:hypothetical protein
MGLTPSDTAGAIALIQNGRSKYYVARAFLVFQDTVSKELLNDFQKPGYTRRVRSGRKRSRTARDDHFLTLKQS